MSSAIAACALCGLQRPIRDSHIIHERCFKPLYGGPHRFHILTTPDADDHRPYGQRGFNAPLLCDECEGKLNDWYEKPFFRMWFEQPILPQPVPKVAIIKVPDYAAFKLFHLSVLWRAGVAAQRNANAGFWKSVYLAPRHEAQIRTMLLARDPGPDTLYPIVAWPLVQPDDPGKLANDLILPPTDNKLGSMHASWFIYAGCSWLYAHSSHYDPSTAILHLKTDGSLPVARTPYTEIGHLMQAAAESIAREGVRRRTGP